MTVPVYPHELMSTHARHVNTRPSELLTNLRQQLAESTTMAYVIDRGDLAILVAALDAEIRYSDLLSATASRLAERAALLSSRVGHLLARSGA